MNTSTLIEELAPLNARIEQVQARRKTLEEDLRAVEEELNTFSEDQKRFDALRDICNALDRLGELEAGELFWKGLPGVEDPVAHLAGLRSRIAQFDELVAANQDRQQEINKQIEQCLEELYDLHEEVRQAHAREERRKEEFVIEREISELPFSPMVMPWTTNGEDEKVFRRAVVLALLWCLFLAYFIPLVKVPLPPRDEVVEIPKRLATLVKKEPPIPEKVKKAPPEEKKPQDDQKLAEQKPQQEPAPKGVANAELGPKDAARAKAENTGIMAFKGAFADLMKETPVAHLGTEARLSKSNQAAGQARATRSLVALQGQAGSGGIGNAAFSRNIGIGNGGGGGGGSRIGGVGFARVESSLAGIGDGGAGRPLSDGPGPARTDEEIQIVFDRYKATLYRIYNTELRKNPTLRGKILLRITIEPGGEVSVCKVESTDLASPELVAKIVERVKRFNFGPKEDVPKTTILYPIDFLPAG